MLSDYELKKKMFENNGLTSSRVYSLMAGTDNTWGP